MQLIWLFFSFSGRISRKSFWLATLILMASSMAVSASLAAAFNIGWSDYWRGSQRAALLELVTIIAFAWPNLAVEFKRLHDCDHSGWRAATVHILIIMLVVLKYGGYDTGDTLTIILFNIHQFITLVLFLWIMIEMGFFSGDLNTNQFGAPPETGDDGPLKAATDLQPGPMRKHSRLNRQARPNANSTIGPHHVPDS